jgi:hypothetical protein
MAGIMIDDEELEHHVWVHLRDKMTTAARTFMELQTKDIVAGELARLKFADPNMKTLENVVKDALTPLIDERLRITLKPMVKECLKELFS